MVYVTRSYHQKLHQKLPRCNANPAAAGCALPQATAKAYGVTGAPSTPVRKVRAGRPSLLKRFAQVRRLLAQP